MFASAQTKERAPRSSRSRAWIAAGAVGRAFLLVAAVAWAAGCCSYRVTCSNPYPNKTTLNNRLVKLRKVTFPHAWYQARHQRVRARHLADWLTSAFPDDPLVTQGYLRVDVEIISDHSLPESSDIEAAVLTQGLWPTTLTTKSRETVILKFYDYDNRYLFEAATRQLRMTDSECCAATALGWVPRVFRRGWCSEATYLKKRMEILRDATLFLLDSPPTLRACVANAGALASIMPLYDRGDMKGPLGGDKGEAPVLGPVGQRWAVIVGVTDYKYAGVKGLEDLRYADRDARGVYRQLVEGDPDHWPKENVVLLTDRRATTAAVNHAILSFLKKAQKDDLVLIFFSGHGAADPARRDNSYLVCYDTDPERLDTTGFPVWRISDAVKRGIIEARRVVVFSDACRGGGVAETGRKDLSFARGDVTARARGMSGDARIRTVSSCASNEQSLEKAEWGGGHGAFAWALIRGLAGAADLDAKSDKNALGDRGGKIELDELAHYVKRMVGDLTNNAQHAQDTGGFNCVVKYLEKDMAPLPRTKPKEPAAGKAGSGPK